MEEPEPTSGKTYTWDSEASVLVRWPKSDANVVSVVRGGVVKQQSVGQIFDQLLKKSQEQTSTLAEEAK